jgi:hypothetical protein
LEHFPLYFSVGANCFRRYCPAVVRRIPSLFRGERDIVGIIAEIVAEFCAAEGGQGREPKRFVRPYPSAIRDFAISDFRKICGVFQFALNFFLFVAVAELRRDARTFLAEAESRSIVRPLLRFAPALTIDRSSFASAF